MKLDTPALSTPIDQLKIIGQPVDRVEGALKTTGTARYAYENHDVVANQAYGYFRSGRSDRHRDRSALAGRRSVHPPYVRQIARASPG